MTTTTTTLAATGPSLETPLSHEHSLAQRHPRQEAVLRSRDPAAKNRTGERPLLQKEDLEAVSRRVEGGGCLALRQLRELDRGAESRRGLVPAIGPPQQQNRQEAEMDLVEGWVQRRVKGGIAADLEL